MVAVLVPRADTFKTEDRLADGDFLMYNKLGGAVQRVRNPARPKAVVIHTAEPRAYTRNAAEAVAEYGRRTEERVAWHATTDEDSIIWCMPERFDTNHASGYNTGTLGIEIATRAEWLAPKDDPDWQRANHALLINTAKVVSYWCHRFVIPVVDVNHLVFDAALKGRNTVADGIFGHFATQPWRRKRGLSARSDPGAHFPWEFFINAVKDLLKHRIKEGDFTRPMDDGNYDLPSVLTPDAERPDNPSKRQPGNVVSLLEAAQDKLKEAADLVDFAYQEYVSE